MRKPWIKIIKDSYKKSRPYIALISVICISLSPLIENEIYKVVALTVLSSILVSIVLDLFSEIEKRFDVINSKLGVKEPPIYYGFNEALPYIKQVLIDNLLKNEDISIKIIAVSAQFSWKSIVEVLLPELLAYNRNKVKFEVEFTLVDPEVLRLWGQKKLCKYCQTVLSLKEIIANQEEYKSAIESGRLKLNVHLVDNVPHWHGLLINDDILFLGRSKWDMTKRHKEMHVGRKEYRKYTINDRFQGYQRVEVFQQWFDAYKFRSQYNPFQENGKS